MENFHNIVKHFSSASANRKKCDSVLEDHRNPPINQLEKYNNGTMLVATRRLLKLALMLKTGTHVYCNKFNMPSFLTDE